MRDAAALLAVTAEDREDIAVNIEQRGPLPEPRLRRSGDRLIVDGRVGRVRGCDAEDVTLARHGRLTYSQLPIVRVRMPRDAVISISGAVKSHIGPTQSARIALATCADTVLGDVAGPLNLALAGNGNVRGGAVERAELRAAGSGAVTLGAIEQGLIVSIFGSSSVRTGPVRSGDVRIAVQGSGDVIMGGGRSDAMTIFVGGAGEVIFPGAARSLDAVVAGSGDIVVGSVTGPVTRRIAGGGDVIIGR
ncbi:MAG: hypothetical protein AB7J28_10290 [Hyphomonadaceae bacterium]